MLAALLKRSRSPEELPIEPPGEAEESEGDLQAYKLCRAFLELEAAACRGIAGEIEASRTTVESEGAELNKEFATLVHNVRAQSERIARVLDQTGSVEIDGEATSYASLISSTTADIDRLLAQVTRLMADAQQLTEVVGKVADAGNRIAQSLEVVEQVNRRSEILALNALIEAEHAGAHGRGFATVAQEVKDLATSVDELARRMRDDVGAINLELGRGRTSLAALAAVDRGDLDRLASSVSTAMHAFDKRGTGLEQWLREAQVGADEISSSIKNVMTGVQFEDIVCQQLDVCIRMLQTLEVERGRHVRALPETDVRMTRLAEQLLNHCVVARGRDRVAGHLDGWVEKVQPKPASAPVDDVELF